LRALHKALWELYVNGREPKVVLNERCSFKEIAEEPSQSLSDVHERIVWEANTFLSMALAGRRKGNGTSH
jgi:hypothetical protein